MIKELFKKWLKAYALATGTANTFFIMSLQILIFLNGNILIGEPNINFLMVEIVLFFFNGLILTVFTLRETGVFE